MSLEEFGVDCPSMICIVDNLAAAWHRGSPLPAALSRLAEPQPDSLTVRF